MKRKLQECDKEKKEIIIQNIVAEMKKHPEVLFAYLHGSFPTDDRFNDIDIAVYLHKTPESPLEYELNMEIVLSNAVAGLPVDVRVLNGAPLSFRYNVIKSGMPIIVHDDNERTEFQEHTLKNYFDFAPFRKLYLHEVFRLAV